MIKCLITGGCSFSDENENRWPFKLYHLLKTKAPNLKHITTGISCMGQDRIQKELTYAISHALALHDPKEILVCVMWSATTRRSWYVDNPIFINQIVKNTAKSTDGFSMKLQLNNFGRQSRREIFIQNKDQSNFLIDLSGGWVHNKANVHPYHFLPFDFLMSEMCLNKSTPGESLVHRSIENIIGLQNFCYNYSIKLIHQFFMDHVYSDIIEYKDHQIIKYLYKQLDKEHCITQGMFEYLNERAGLSPNISFSERQNTPKGREYFEDGFHSSSKGALVWVEDVLLPFLKSKNITV